MKTFIVISVSIFRIPGGNLGEARWSGVEFFVIFSLAQDRKLTPSMKWSTAMIWRMMLYKYFIDKIPVRGECKESGDIFCWFILTNVPLHNFAYISH